LRNDPGVAAALIENVQAVIAMELAAVKGLLRAALKVTKELETKYAATTAVLRHGAKPANPDDDPLEQQIQSLIDETASRSDMKWGPGIDCIKRNLWRWNCCGVGPGINQTLGAEAELRIPAQKVITLATGVYTHDQGCTLQVHLFELR
jgi:hypothetical protein